MTPPGASVVEAPALGSFATAWDELVASAEVPSPFLRSWWLESLVGPKSVFVLVLDGDRLIGGLALERGRGAAFDYHRFLGHGVLCPDHLDMVARPDRVDETVRALRGWLASRPTRILDVRGVTGGALLVAAFPEAGIDHLDVAPYARTADGLDAYLATRPPRFQVRMARSLRKVQRRGLSVRQVDAAQVPECMVDFATMHSSRPERQALMAEFPRLDAAVRAGADRGEAWVFVAERGQERAAVLVAFVACGRLSLYQSARWLRKEDNDIGTVLDYTAVRRACEAGLTEVDFLRGDEAYKYTFTSSERDLLRLRVAGGAPGRLLIGVLGTGGQLRRRGASVLRRLRAGAVRRR